MSRAVEAMEPDAAVITIAGAGASGPWRGYGRSLIAIR